MCIGHPASTEASNILSVTTVNCIVKYLVVEITEFDVAVTLQRAGEIPRLAVDLRNNPHRNRQPKIKAPTSKGYKLQQFTFATTHLALIDCEIWGTLKG